MVRLSEVLLQFKLNDYGICKTTAATSSLPFSSRDFSRRRRKDVKASVDPLFFSQKAHHVLISRVFQKYSLEVQINVPIVVRDNIELVKYDTISVSDIVVDEH